MGRVIWTRDSLQNKPALLIDRCMSQPFHLKGTG